MRVNLNANVNVNAHDATTIDLCFSLFDWAAFRKTNVVIRLHTLLDLRGTLPAFMHINDRKMHEVNVLNFLAIKFIRFLTGR